MRLLQSDLAGWRMAGAGGFRILPEGGVEAQGGPGLLWYAETSFADFELAVAWRIIRPDDNSGVFLRCPPLADDPQAAIEQGYEVQIDDRGYDSKAQVTGSPLHLTGAIYRLAPALRRCSRPVGEWNRFEIATTGPDIAVRLNGQDVARLPDGQRRLTGHIALQNHHAGSAVQFRDLEVRPR